ncbi:hypothetical protein VT84_07235 [Gemmata sp. SH-PL17]|nr:hypothetical protein VT84_07235 [Gemmata sp. SH-PL17]
MRLAPVRVPGRGVAQAVPQVPGRAPGLAHVRVRHPQVEQGERVPGALVDLAVQDPQVPVPLAHLARRGVVVPGVDHEQVGPRDLPSGPADRGQDLLVDPVLEPELGPVPEQFDVVHHGQVVGPGRARAVDPDHVPEHRGPVRPAGQVPERAPVGRVDHVVRVHPEHPRPARVAHGLVAGRGEVVDPREVEHPGPQPGGDFGGAVDRARVHHDEFVDPRAQALQARPDRARVVAHDQAPGQVHGARVAGQDQPAPGVRADPELVPGRARPPVAPGPSGGAWGPHLARNRSAFRARSAV